MLTNNSNEPSCDLFTNFQLTFALSAQMAEKRRAYHDHETVHVELSTVICGLSENAFQAIAYTSNTENISRGTEMIALILNSLMRFMRFKNISSPGLGKSHNATRMNRKPENRNPKSQNSRIENQHMTQMVFRRLFDRINITYSLASSSGSDSIFMSCCNVKELQNHSIFSFIHGKESIRMRSASFLAASSLAFAKRSSFALRISSLASLVFNACDLSAASGVVRSDWQNLHFIAVSWISSTQ